MQTLLDAIVALAITFHDLERDKDRQTIEALLVGDRLKTADAGAIPDICTAVERLGSAIGGTFDLSCSASKLLRDVDATHMGEDAVALVRRLRRDAERTSGDILKLRQTMRRIDETLAAKVHDLRLESDSARVLRLIGDAGADAGTGSPDFAAIVRLVADDHKAVADAYAAWRLMGNGGVVMVVTDHTSDEELRHVLRGLVADGMLIRRPSLKGGRWSVAPRSDPKDSVLAELTRLGEEAEAA